MRVGGEPLDGATVPPTAAPSRHEDAEEDLVGPRPQIRPFFVAMLELECAFDRVLNDVIGRSRVRAEALRARA
jgi:hypothetical protein